MLPPLKATPDLSHPLVDQLVASEADLIHTLFKQSSSIAASMDGSGWSISWLLGIFHKPTLNPIASSLARVSALLVNGKAGPTLEFILSLGVLSPINKQSQALQNAAVLAGNDLKLRLVCQSTFSSKAATKCLIDSDPAKDIIKNSAPVQLGIGVPNGVAIKFAAVNSAYQTGSVIVARDVQNAFFEIKRKQMFEQLRIKGPSLLTGFTALYGHTSPAIFTFHLPEGSTVIEFFKVEEGAKIGDVAGSFLFCVGIQPIFEKLLTEFPPNIAALVAVVDDLDACFVPPADPLDPLAWEALYANIRLFLERYETLAAEAGLSLNAKGGVLLPPGAPIPNNLPGRDHPGFRIVQGLVTVGGPIGPLTFIDDHNSMLLDRAQSRVDSVLQLSDRHPQMATHLLTLSCNHTLDFAFRLLPDAGTLGTSTKFDAIIDLARDVILNPKSHGPRPVMSADRHARGRLLARLPDGMGQLPSTLISIVANICNCSAIASHALISASPSVNLQHFTTSMTDLALYLDCDNAFESPAIGPILSAHLHPALRGSNAQAPFLTPRLKLQRLLVRLIMAQDKFALSSAILGCLETGSATRADVIATIGTVTRSLSHLNFDPDLHDRKSQLEHPLAFIAFARSFLGYL